MIDSLGSPAAQVASVSAILLILSVVGVHVARRFRDDTEQMETTSTMLVKFPEMRLRGELSETEFRTIRTILADRSRTERKRKDDSS